MQQRAGWLQPASAALCSLERVSGMDGWVVENEER